jgi:hypothetical protein
MTDSRPHRPLSPLELIVLARLSSPKPPTERDLNDDVAGFVKPADTPARTGTVLDAVAALRQRGFVDGHKLLATAEGKHALRSAFALARTPTWAKVQSHHLPALGLGIELNSAEASKLDNADELALAVLRYAKAPRAKTIVATCNALIAARLGLSGPLTLRRIQAHVLTQVLKEQFKITPKEPLDIAAKETWEGFAARAIAVSLGETVTGQTGKACKRLIQRGLGRRWAYQVTVPSEPHVDQPMRTTPVQSILPLTGADDRAPGRPAVPPPTLVPNPPHNGGRLPPLETKSADMLLRLVREAVARIGSDGRFGSEKVFVSAIWHHIERDGLMPELSIDRFKRWLVIANREQLIDLARADLVGAMDPKLVAESEIEDLGATFHFVVDRAGTRSNRGSYAR